MALKDQSRVTAGYRGLLEFAGLTWTPLQYGGLAVSRRVADLLQLTKGVPRARRARLMAHAAAQEETWEAVQIYREADDGARIGGLSSLARTLPAAPGECL